MKTFYQSLLVLGVVFLGLSCSKTYNLPPLSSSSSAPTSTPNPLVCTASPTPGAPPSGIYWYSAQVEGVNVSNSVNQYHAVFADVLLAVNGLPESTATVNLSAPPVLATLPYFGNVVQNGNTYALYWGFLTSQISGYQAGAAYSLSTITSIGTASATLIGPGAISLASNGSSASWTMPGLQNTLMVQVVGMFHSAATIYQTAACANETSPVNIPASDYSFTDQTNYTVTADCQTSTAALTGGTGNFKVHQDEILMLDKNATPTPTAASCGGGGPACTPSPTPIPDSFTISSVVFQPAVAPVILSLSYPNYPGDYYLAVFNDSGTHIKTLDAIYRTAPYIQNYIWDGTDKYGNPAPSGVYVFSQEEPFDWKLRMILLLR